jgi:D-serine deaminase-like pyridoxal phosphate-dependent protein
MVHPTNDFSEVWRECLRDATLPAVLVDLDAFDRNVRYVADTVRAAGGRATLRPATKSVRVPALLRRIAAADPIYQGWMTYSAQETLCLWRDGFDDVLVAYPTVQPGDLAALRAVRDGGGRVALVVDSAAGLRAVARAMAGAAAPLRVLADVDMSVRALGGAVHLGVRRSPLRTIDDVRRLFALAGTMPEVTMVGWMGYDAQLAGLQDANPFHGAMNLAARAVRAVSRRSVRAKRGALAAALARDGYRVEIANGGGSGSIDHAPREPWLTEVTAGSGFMGPHLFDYFTNVRFAPAFFVALQVVRASDDGYVTCQGGGYVASGAPGWDKVPVPWWPRGAALLPTEGVGEVQTPLRLRAGDEVAIGDIVLLRHAKGGELAERFNEYRLVRRGEVVGRAETYRGRGWCFG